MPSPLVEHDHTIDLAADALLREHPDALVCGLSGNGLIVAIPGPVARWGQAAIEGRALIDVVVAEDRTTVVGLWQRVDREGAVQGKVRLLSKPSRWVTLHFLDLRQTSDVLLGIVIPSDDQSDPGSRPEDELPPAPPRISTLTEDENAKVLECDDAFTQMFGYTAAELIGNSVLDQIHPEDQGRAVEGWLAVLSTRRDQYTRLRRKRKDGSWMWVDTTLHNYLNQPDSNHVLVELIDVSAEMAAQEALQEREELLRRLTDGMPDGLLQLDGARNVVYNNARLLDILHGSPYLGAATPDAAAASEDQAADAAPSLTELLSTLSDGGMRAFTAALRRVLDESVDQDVEVDFVLPSGEWRSALMSIRSLLRPTGEVNGAITSVLDITDSVRARQELERRATFDALTGCHNRSSILSALQTELQQANSQATALVYVDLDNFKSVNDTLGHAAGDELLVQFAERLKDMSRGNDDVGRLGGDEFIMLLRSISGAEAAMQVAHRISESVGRTFALSTGPVQLRASMGVALTGSETVTAEELIKRADAAMYLSKAQANGLPVLDTDTAAQDPRAASGSTHVAALSPGR